MAPPARGSARAQARRKRSAERRELRKNSHLHLRLLGMSSSSWGRATQQLDFLAVPRIPRHLHFPTASDRGWHPLGGGGASFISSP